MGTAMGPVHEGNEDIRDSAFHHNAANMSADLVYHNCCQEFENNGPAMEHKASPWHGR